MSDVKVNVEGKDGGGRSGLRDLFPNSPSAAAAAAASNMLASCAELQHILDKMDATENNKLKQALELLTNRANQKIVRVFIAKEVLASFAKFASNDKEEVELALFSDVVLVYSSVVGGNSSFSDTNP
jgi:hypothetical protein